MWCINPPVVQPQIFPRAISCPLLIFHWPEVVLAKVAANDPPGETAAKVLAADASGGHVIEDSGVESGRRKDTDEACRSREERS